MNHWALFLLLVLLPVSALADSVYHIRPLSEKQLLTMYERVMIDACRHADSQWHEWPEDPRGGHWGTGMSDGNEGIRAISEMALTCGTLLQYSDALNAEDRREYMRKTTAAIHYAASTHVTGAKKCTDGKQWGANWQSAMWAGTLGFGAWLIWDDLEPELRAGVERVVSAEADRFLNIRPPGGRWNDTKAEENGWNMICISLAANMFPEHPLASARNEKAVEYMMNTLSVPADQRSGRIVDGRPVRDWITFPNLHPDFTLENHGFFHLSYVECSCYFLTQAAMHYMLAGRPVPQAATHHLADTLEMLRTLLLPCGESARPQGMDWELHGLPSINLMASIGAYLGDRTAAGMEPIVLQRMRRWQEMQDGNLTVPGSRLGFTRHAIVAEQAAYGFLAHKIFPTVPKAVSNHGTPNGVRKHNSVGVIAHRTDSKLFSFSWKYRIMGMLAPIGEGHLGNPHFTVPILNGFVGSMELDPAGDAKITVIERSWDTAPWGFETSAVLMTCGGRLRQEVKVSSIGEKTVVYQDRVTAIEDIRLLRELGVPIGIENDSLSGGRRTVFHRDGSTTFDWRQPLPTAAVPGGWANVDGRLGIVAAAGSGFAYDQADAYNAQAVYADALYGSFSDSPRDFRAGDEVARRIVVLYVETTPEETSALAEGVRAENGEPLRIRLPEGSEQEIRLL